MTVLLVALMSFAAERLARYVPFSYEQSITERFADDEDAGHKPVRQRLQALADELSAVMDLPDDMTIHVHYVDEDTVNAFATLGGHIVIYRGLLEATPTENALAMVVAHEIAHVKHRDPIVALGRAVLIGTALAVFTGVSGDDMAGRVLGDAGLLTSLHFSREQESEADHEALSALAQRYGHVAGATFIFEKFLADENKSSYKMPALFGTHPTNRKRIEQIHRWGTENGWPDTGETTLLPDFSG
ncbi:MAG: M48 family metallopeptidase [Gammaproteobacteria bacterium]